ncbi:MAG: hypothetical protein DRH07_01370 [Deltaproteobacteria bacterium]|nr:MAG: hypothetical protein DRH07_01370 [Deltaproteobacteria bacterium]
MQQMAVKINPLSIDKRGAKSAILYQSFILQNIFGDFVKQEITDNSTLGPDSPLLATFLHELNIARRQLALYPPGHPQIETSVKRTLEVLEELFLSDPVITIGISPDALYFGQVWLNKDDPTNQEFANFFSTLGIASISFRRGLQAAELIRFNQLLRQDQNTTESFGKFDKSLEQQRIEHISVIPIDYDAFQASLNPTENKATSADQLWEGFLHGLHSGILDFGDQDSPFDVGTVADIFNQKLVGSQAEREQSSRSVSLFIENSILQKESPQSPSDSDKKLAQLLEHLSAEAQQKFLSSAFQTLDQHRDKAPAALKKIPRHLIQNTIAGEDQHSLKLSSRMFGLINNLANSQTQEFQQELQGSLKVKSEALSTDVVRARLDVLFSEERQDMYMPDNYQSALHSILSDKFTGTIPEEEKQKLKELIEGDSAEKNCTAIIFDLIHDQLEPEQEKAIEQNLLELSRFFLDVGDFVNLRKIHTNWSKCLYSGKSAIDILNEKVLSSQAQPTFMSEVLDGIDLWGEEKYQEIADYIISIGEPYCEPVIEYLGLAPTESEQQLWIEILEKIGGDAQQMIIESLDDERWELVRNLLVILGKDLDPKNLKAIHKLIAHPHPRVRLEVTRILFSCNPATANRQLLNELNSEDPEAQSAAIQIADLSRDPNVLSILHKQLGEPIESDIDLELRTEAVKTLTRIGNKDSLPVLRRILQKQGLLVSRRVKQLQVEIIQNLFFFPGTSAKKLLKELANGKYKQQVELAMEQRREFLRGRQ